jgi:hypothetical protein
MNTVYPTIPGFRSCGMDRVGMRGFTVRGPTVSWKSSFSGAKRGRAHCRARGGIQSVIGRREKHGGVGVS